MRPACRVEINGRAIDTALTGPDGVLISLEVTDEAGHKADTFTLELDDREGFPAPPVGAQIKLWLGYEPAPPYIGSFTVDEWSKRGPRRQLRVSAKSAEMTSDVRAPRLDSHHALSVAAIVRKLAARHNLQPIIDSVFESMQVPHIDQQHESDLAFLARLGRRAGANFKVADGKALFSQRGSSKLPGGGSKPTIAFAPQDVSAWAAASQARGDFGSVKAMWHDHSAGKRRSVTSGSGKPVHHHRKLYGSQAEAQAAADGHRADLKRGTLQVELEGPGNPKVFADALASLSGFDPAVDGTYLIKSVRHSLTSAGYKTTMQLEVATKS